MMQLAPNQPLLAARIDTHETRLIDYEGLLEQIEATLGDPGRNITPEQATSISQAVKTIAMALSKKIDRNEYGAAYGEFYRKFGISSYRELSARQFDAAVAFLTGWHQDVMKEEALLE